MSEAMRAATRPGAEPQGGLSRDARAMMLYEANKKSE
jgi:hypothetical protein